MDSLFLPNRIYYGYLSRMYGLTYRLTRQSFLGLRLSSLARWIPLLGLLIGWIAGWPWLVLALIALVAMWINFSLWRAKKDNYLRFVPDRDSIMGSTELAALPPNHKVAVVASGLFCVSDRESRLLNRPANYWYVPLGEHIVMVEETPGKYLYQFFNPGSLQEVSQGWLLHGAVPRRSVAIRFLSGWGPEFAKYGQLYETVTNDRSPSKPVTIYLTADEATHELIWQTIIKEARRVRNEVVV
jgi:hypothetical protein